MLHLSYWDTTQRRQFKTICWCWKGCRSTAGLMEEGQACPALLQPNWPDACSSQFWNSACWLCLCILLKTYPLSILSPAAVRLCRKPGKGQTHTQCIAKDMPAVSQQCSRGEPPLLAGRKPVGLAHSPPIVVGAQLQLGMGHWWARSSALWVLHDTHYIKPLLGRHGCIMDLSNTKEETQRAR